MADSSRDCGKARGSRRLRAHRHENGHTDDVLITTTTEHLAIRLGRALEKAFDGRVLYGFSHENKLAHVWWHRDAA
jgi:hypothetical protein